MGSFHIRPFLLLAVFFAFMCYVERTNAASPAGYSRRGSSGVVINNQNVVCQEDSSVQITLDAKGPNGVELSYNVFKPSRGTVTKLSENTVIYTPCPDYFGPDLLRFSVSNKEYHISNIYGDVLITVNPSPDKPIAQGIEVLMVESSPVEIDLAAFDPDGNDLTYVIKSPPENGIIELIDAQHGIYLYKPKAGYRGEDKFSFIANDGQNDSNPATVNIRRMPEAENFLKMPTSQVYANRVLEPLKVEKPVDLVLDRTGNLFILSAPDNGQSKVLVCDSQLQVQRGFDIDARNPRGIAVSDSNLYVADTGGNRILRYSIDGKLDTTFGNNGSIGQAGDANGQFNKPWAVGVDWDKNIYVTDSGDDRIQIFNNSGKFKDKWRQKTAYDTPWKPSVQGLAHDCEYYQRYLKQLTSEPRSITGFGQIHAAERVPLKNPTGFCLLGSSSSGEIFLADTGNHKIKRLSSGSGYLYSSTGQEGGGSGCLRMPADTAYDLEKDQLIVADAGNNRIQVLQLSSHGEFFSTNAMTCAQQIDDQGLSSPLAVAVRTEQPNQFIYVADTGNNRVLKLQNGVFRPGTSPVDVWEKFKAALRKDDIDKALTFITPFARDDYAHILREMKPHLKEFVNGMGKLTPESIEAGSAQYELEHTDPNGDIFSFPIYFNLDEKGNWTITKF